MDDRGLLTDIAGGSEPALRALFDRHRSWMAGRLRARMSIDAVEDVLQETFLAIWRGADRYQADAEVSAWIWGIARRQAALWYRKHGRHQQAAAFLNDGLSARDDPEQSAIVQVDLQRAFASLGSGAQDLARQAFVEDRPMSEIARSLNIPQGTVKSRIFNLRRKLSEALGQEHKP